MGAGAVRYSRRAHYYVILLRFARRHLSTSRLLLAGVALGIITARADDVGYLFFHLFSICGELMYWMMGGIWRRVDWQQRLRLMIALIRY